MKFIDKEAKLFGKINILDIAIVLVLLGAVVFFFTRGGVPTIVGGGQGQTQTHVVRFFAHRLDPFVVEHIQLGDAVVVQGHEISLGRVTHINIMEGIEYHPNSEGVLTGSPLGDTVTIEIESQLELPVGSIYNGLHIGGNRYAIGGSNPVRFGDSLIFLRISYIGVLDN